MIYLLIKKVKLYN